MVLLRSGAETAPLLCGIYRLPYRFRYDAVFISQSGAVASEFMLRSLAPYRIFPVVRLFCGQCGNLRCCNIETEVLKTKLNYKNAADVLPDTLLRELQKYVDGGMIYIPSTGEGVCGWGEKNGTRDKYRSRNAEIRLRHKGGATPAQLCREYCLSGDSIKKIIYSKET